MSESESDDYGVLLCFVIFNQKNIIWMKMINNDKISRHASQLIDQINPKLWPKIDLFVHNIFAR